METRDKLREIVGGENFSGEAKDLETYARDFSLEPSGMPSYVVKHKDAQEVQ